MEQRFVFEFKLNVVIFTFWDLVYKEINLNSALWNRFFLLRL
ncbi:MAG: hypothetical protein ACK521_04685 [bacterium]